jgi:urease accessory protein
MPNSLALILSETRFPSGQPPHSGGVEVACATGLIKDPETLRAFLRGRLDTAGTIGAYVAAAVCARSVDLPAKPTLWRTVEAELDARIASPAARLASRRQGGEALRLALTINIDPRLDSLARATVGYSQQPHHPVALGAIGAVAGASPKEAAASAAWASVSGSAFAAQQILHLEPGQVAEIGVDLVPDVESIATAAAAAVGRPLSELPCFAAPALAYLAEEHAARVESIYAS